MTKLYLVFDVESIGLHGEAFAVGYVVVDDNGTELESGYHACSPDWARGNESNREWVEQNCQDIEPDSESPRGVRLKFWDVWERWRDRGAVMVADCSWPVEARFLAACVEDDLAVREWGGPYPLHDVATMRLAAGFDPLAKVERLQSELPIHDPLADARQSARLWIEASKVVRDCIPNKEVG